MELKRIYDCKITAGARYDITEEQDFDITVMANNVKDAMEKASRACNKENPGYRSKEVYDVNFNREIWV